MQVDLKPGYDLRHMKKYRMRTFKKQAYAQSFVLLGILFILIFRYTPMFGILMAFKNYKITSGIQGIFTSEWVGLKYFRKLQLQVEQLGNRVAGDQAA